MNNDMTQIIGLLPHMTDAQVAQMKATFDQIIAAINEEIKKREHAEGQPDA